ncbi:MAG TPA: hypothetical protein VKZ79_22050 [Alphaproteobacteria bacterium]|nr:hypothetical protein [Alphaproteobacteria bacterium]
MIRLLLILLFVVFHARLALADSNIKAFDLQTMPQRERDFIGILRQAQDKFGGARTTESRRNVRLEMQMHLADFAKLSPSALDWIGVVHRTHTDRAGFASISIEIWPDINFSTATSRLADPQNQTLITAGTKLYETVSRLETGRVVKFGAVLIGGRLASDEEMVRHPVVMVRFTSLTPED